MYDLRQHLTDVGCEGVYGLDRKILTKQASKIDESI